MNLDDDVGGGAPRGRAGDGTLAQRHEVAWAVVRGVVVPVSRRQHHACGPDLLLEVVDHLHTTNPPPLPVPPDGSTW